ncbi:DUF6053 domain-containing protein [Lysobacter sp. CA199]|uniref:DUF6053 domain-containing protein n=1 Tax=Lysobacter sp. CA199 TaxID=3455608 RepID=UPI003F8D5DB5
MGDGLAVQFGQADELPAGSLSGAFAARRRRPAIAGLRFFTRNYLDGAPRSFVGGASAPTLFDQIAAIGKNSVGAEAPPTKDFAPAPAFSAMRGWEQSRWIPAFAGMTSKATSAHSIFALRSPRSLLASSRRRRGSRASPRHDSEGSGSPPSRG